jgi:3-dehydroquinate synthase
MNHMNKTMQHSKPLYCQISSINDILPKEKTLVITDPTIFELYGHHFESFHTIVTAPGEKNKNMHTMQLIYDELMHLKADRTWFICGIGGGIVCDMAGFAASTYCRGTKLCLAPTTLLAQADAAIGGKNGVNYQSYKNMIGCFKQPDYIICDTSLLLSLPEKEYRNGLAEMIKHAALASENLFVRLECILNEQKNKPLSIPADLIKDAADIKIEITRNDFFEQDKRKILNFGHTIAHAIEHCTNRYSHGEAVAIGMAKEAHFSCISGILEEESYLRLCQLIKQAGLPIDCDMPAPELMNAILHDKKKHGNTIHIPMLTEIGSCYIESYPIDVFQALMSNETAYITSQI